ncbi:MAG: diphosphate--fructose-6-phosphate 1-phosphotransferase [bacterium]
MNNTASGNIGILVGGGPAPGINGVIAAVTIEARKKGINVYGINDGYKWLVSGDSDLLKKNIRELHIKDVSRIHFDGGSILYTSRTNPKNIKNGPQNCVKLLQELGIKYMVTIGGDDTAYGASLIAKAAEGKIRFAHVPKTIDNDLPLPHNIPTFGFQTAREYGSILVKNLMEDSKTTHRWYIAVTMGRHSGHLALGVAKSAAATLVIIPEEFENEEVISLSHVCDILETSVIKRMAMGHDFGVMVIAEGIAERLDPQELKKLPGLKFEYDEYGHMRLDEVELGKVVKYEVERRFRKRGNKKFRIVELNIGYVLRSADPIPFDLEYTRDLGYNAFRYLMSKKPEHQKNAMIIVDNGVLRPLSFDEMMDLKTGKTAVRFVNIEGEAYNIARKYMIRLEKRDIEEKEMLKKMSEIANMSENEFIERFQYLIK